MVLAPIRIEPLERTVDVPGQLYGDEQATISAKVPGRVREVLADVGDRIGDGAVLARIDPTDYELVVSQKELALAETLAKLGLDELPPAQFDVNSVATVQRAAHEAQNAKAKLDRAKQLHEETPPLISDQEFADIQTAQEVAGSDTSVAVLDAKSTLSQARSRSSELDAAHQRLADTAIRAPGVSPAVAPATMPAADASAATRAATTDPAQAGALPRFAVTERLISPGEYVREGDPLYRVVADNPIKFRAGISERFVPDVKTGQSVKLRVEGFGRVFAGKVSRVNPAIDLQTQTFQVEVLIDNPDRTLKPGAFARASIVIGEDRDVTFVPKSSVVTFAGVNRVFSVKDGKAVEHKVILRDAERDDHVALVDGIKDTKDVVTSGNQKLANDIPITLQHDQAAMAPQ